MKQAYVKPPEALLARGLVECAAFPLVADHKKGRGYRVPAEEAWRKPFLASFPENSLPAFITDNDEPEALVAAVMDGRVPQPNAVMTNPETNHQQAWWFLEKPVHYNEKSSQQAIDFYEDINAGLVNETAADKGFNQRGRHRSLLYEGHGIWWGRETPYVLDEFYRVPRVRGRDRAPTEFAGKGLYGDIEDIPVGGRNKGLFRIGMSWQGRPCNLHESVYPFLVWRNAQLSSPLPFSEVETIAKSITKYRDMGWSSRSYIPDPEKQSKRGKRSGAARRARTADRDAQIAQDRAEGLTLAAIAARRGISRQMVHKVLNRA